jgi:hypothetical protein
VGCFEVFLVAHSTFDETSIHVMGVFLDIDDGAEDQIDFLGEFEQGLVEIKK